MELNLINCWKEKQKEEAQDPEEKSKKKDKPGFDGRWYTDINASNADRFELSILTRKYEFLLSKMYQAVCTSDK